MRTLIPCFIQSSRICIIEWNISETSIIPDCKYGSETHAFEVPGGIPRVIICNTVASRRLEFVFWILVTLLMQRLIVE